MGIRTAQKTDKRLLELLRKAEKRPSLVDQAMVAAGERLSAALAALWRRIPVPVRAGGGVGAVLALVVAVETRLAVLGAAVGVLTAAAVPVGVWQARRRGFLAFLWRPGRSEGRKHPAATAAVKAWPDLTAQGPLKAMQGSSAEAWAVDDVSWSLRVELAPGRTADEVVALSGPLESALDVRRGSLRVLPDDRARRVTLRVIHKDLLAESQGWHEPAARSVLQPIQLGRFEDGEACELALMPAAGAGRSLSLAGQPGSGKSGLLNLIIASLAGCRDVALAGVDPQGVELAPWEPVFASGMLALDAESAEVVLQRVVRLMEARNNRMRIEHARVWAPSAKDPAVVLVCDEGSAIAQYMDLLEEIASRGRKLAVLVVFATQRPSSASLGDRGKEFLSRCQSRIALRLGDATDVDVSLGRGAAREGWAAHQVLRRRGEFLLKDDDHFSVRVARGPYIGDHEVEAWAKKCEPDRPRLEVTK